MSEDAQVKLISDRVIEYARACMYNDRRTSPFESEIRIISRPFDDGVFDMAFFSEAAHLHGKIFTGGVSPSLVFPSNFIDDEPPSLQSHHLKKPDECVLDIRFQTVN